MDRPPKLNRWFIEETIKDAIKKIKAESTSAAEMKLDPAPAVEEQEKGADPDGDPPDDEIVYQWGATGGSRAVLVAETILDRIAKSGVFVADVSFVGEITTADGRKKLLPNPNVLIETGPAARTGEQWNRIVLVLNTAFGTVDQLPFDLKHRTCRIQYELTDTKDPGKAIKRRDLAKKLVEQIQPIYRSAMSRLIAVQKEAAANAVAEGRIRAQAERIEFEQRLKENKFYEFKSRFCVLALSLTPVSPPKTPLFCTSRDDAIIRNFIQPFGITGFPIRHRSKSITVGEREGTVPYSLVELTATGSIFACYNLKFGQDNATPNHFGAQTLIHRNATFYQ
jgi:hypothetical protein